ncbi:MAG: stage II sporulation protein R [Lachnospiraceae bacterium]|nr:stage II sporulation protein R [Lachnospiraceae bacterium]
MKVFRDICIAVLLGVVGGVLVTTISYYRENEEGGIEQTIRAVSNSFDVVAEAYAVGENVDLLLGEDAFEMDEEALAVLGEVDSEEWKNTAELVLGTLLSENDMNEDILVMDEVDGNVEEGEPYYNIMRFHVRANSDSDEDQELKLAVKEDVVTFLKPLLKECTSVAQSKQVLVSNMQNIYMVAMNTIVEQGYDYSVEVYITEETFPEKEYGDMIFPAGDYQALRVDIGEAKGQNWWGIMYPPLCFIDDTTSVVSEEGKEILEDNLTPQEYAELFMKSDVRIESGLWNWIMGE